jgi:hypothetical protein
MIDPFKRKLLPMEFRARGLSAALEGAGDSPIQHDVDPAPSENASEPGNWITGNRAR